MADGSDNPVGLGEFRGEDTAHIGDISRQVSQLPLH